MEISREKSSPPKNLPNLVIGTNFSAITFILINTFFTDIFDAKYV
jgi:hypothetical protein